MNRVQKIKGVFVSALLLGVFAIPRSGFAEPMKIGISVPLTGSAAGGGIAIRDGIFAAAKKYPKNLGVEFVVEDNQFSGNAAIAAYRSLRDSHHVKSIISFGGPAVLAVRPIVEGEKFPMLALSAAVQLDKGGNGSITRIWESSKGLGTLFAELSNQLDRQKPALISYEAEVGLEIRNAAKANLHATSVFDEVVNASETDFSGLVTKLRATQPDLIFLNFVGGQATAIFQKIRNLGVRSPVVFHSGLFFDPKVRSPFPSLYADSYVATVNDQGAQELYDSLRKDGKAESAVYMAAIGFDSATFLLQAIENGWNFEAPLPMKQAKGILGEYHKVSEFSYEPSMRLLKFQGTELVPVQ